MSEASEAEGLPVAQTGNGEGAAGVGKARSFQPMNVNFGLFSPMDAPVRSESGERLRGLAKTQARKRAMSARALGDLAAWQNLAKHAIGEEPMIGRSAP